MRASLLEATGAERKALEELKLRLRGPLIVAGEPGYDETRSVWNAMIDRRPMAIARCLGVADVIACVDFAREHGITPCIKGGGHNIAGLAVSDGALMLDMSLMRGVWVDSTARLAHAQAGCLLGDLDRETQLYDLAAVLGFVSNTGIAGLTLGGGFGYLTRRFGWACDNINAMEVVTADGRIVRATQDENSDLLWALRGGGGNFGVVCNFEYKLHQIGPGIVGGAIGWRFEDAEQVLEFHRTVLAEAPPEFACLVVIRPAPPTPWFPGELHGKLVVMFFICDTGPTAEAERRTSQIKAFGRPVVDILQRRSYTSQQSLIDPTQPKGRRNYWKSDYMQDLTSSTYTSLLEQARRIQSPHSSIVLVPLGEAVRKFPNDYSAMGNRNAKWVFLLLASWEQAQHDQANIDWARAAYQDMCRFSTGGTYVNFLGVDEGEDRLRAAYGSNYDRLAKVKRAWDPQNLFRANKNIPPAGTAT